MFNVNRRHNKFLYEENNLAVMQGPYELIERAELIKEETNANIIIEPDKNTMKFIREIKQGSLNFDIENSIVPLLGFIKIIYKQGKYTSQKITDIMGFSTINIHCIVTSGVKDKANNTLYTFF